MHFLNNTVVGSELSPLYFDLPGQTSGPGRGAFVENSIFDTEVPAFEQVGPDTDLTINHSHLPTDEFDLGVGNRFGHAHVGGADDDYRLLSGSPAAGTGRDGLDMGASIPPVTITGVPSPVTARNDATLEVAGPDITHYRYRINSGQWSDDRSTDQPIRLNNLAPGQYSVSVVGRDVLGIWQAEEIATVSESWTVDRSAAASVRINEVLAHHVSAHQVDGEYPDAIELYNDGTATLDLSGYSLSDQLNDPQRFVFPGGSRIDAGEHLVLWSDASEGASGLEFDFGLDRRGDSVFLFDASGQLLDSVEFGNQLPDRSIGIVDRHGQWNLTHPTLGESNLAASVGDPHALRINEWYASGSVRLANDFIELYNNQPVPVSLDGVWLTDEPYEIPDQFPIRNLSFVDARGYLKFTADGDVEDGADHLNFRLGADHEHIALRSGDGIIDQIFYFPQTSEVSQGRVPDGSSQIEFQLLPSPGLTNEEAATTIIPVLEFTWDSNWLYEASGSDLGTDWIDPSYDDSNWLSGPGLLGNENERLPEPLQTSFPLGDITYYFRKHIQIDADPATVTAEFSTIIDDGAVVYINGQEVRRIGIDNGNVRFDRVANRNINEADHEGPFAIPSSVFVRGNNIIAVEVHQVRTGSSDLVFGMDFAANATLVPQEEDNRQALLEDLRITEIMYNPANDGLEFIEVQNTSTRTLDMHGVRLDGGIEFTFPSTTLSPGERVVVAENIDRLLTEYGSGINVVGQFSGNLSNGSDELILRLPEPFAAAILRFEYDASWQPETDGGGRSLQVVDVDASFTDWGDRANWKASATSGGTPGHDGLWTPETDGIVFNEIVSHTDPPLTDSIELFNQSNTAVDVGGWYISDSETQFEKFRIPLGTSIAARGYLVFDESDFNASVGVDPKDFALDGARGERLWLWKTDGTSQLERIADTVAFGATANAEAWGRAPDGVGEFTPLVSPSLGSSNQPARVGPVVISEVHYHPSDPSPAALQVDASLTDEDLEFIEIFNPTRQVVDLTNWRIRSGIDFDFAPGTTLAATSALLIVPFDPVAPANAQRLAAFRAEYQLPAATRIVGGYAGRLSNAGENIRLLRPDEPPMEDPDFVPALLEDAVRYDDAGAWPTTADGQGHSLTRTMPAELGRDATSWSAAQPTPGSVGGLMNIGDFNDDGVIDHADVALMCDGMRTNAPRFDLNGDGTTDGDDLDVLIEDLLGTTAGDANLDGKFDSSDLIEVFRSGEYEDGIRGNSTWAEGDWNCDGEFNSTDIIAAFRAGSYVSAARNAALDAEMIRDIAAAAPDHESARTK